MFFGIGLTIGCIIGYTTHDKVDMVVERIKKLWKFTEKGGEVK